MDIVIVAQYILDITKNESLNSRFVYLANMLKKNHTVEIVTSDFIHSTKENICPISSYRGIQITMLHECGYKKNISLRRFVSHAELAGHISGYLRKRKKPDVIYCAIPSTDVAAAVATYCRRNHVKFIVDIQDLWPEAFKMVFRVPYISDFLFYPIARKTNRVYRTADAIVSVSDTYLNRARQVNRYAKTAVVFLGADKEYFNDYGACRKAGDGMIRLVYVGSLEKSYDLTTAIKAVSTCDNVQLVVIGDGSRRKELECFARENAANCVFTGYLPYTEMIAKMAECDIAINPIHKGSAGSVINKVGDYAMVGLPVINTQESQEYRNLLEKYKCGINCACENADDVIKTIKILSRNEHLRNEMSLRARKMGEELFDRGRTYSKIINLIESI